MDKNLLAERHELDAEALSEHIRANFSGSLCSLRQLDPFVREMLRRFKHLPRKRGVDGTYKNISGHRSFKSWCNGVLNRSDRTVRYMLAGGNGKRSKPQSDENVSALAARLLKYLDVQLDRVDRSKKYLVISEIINELIAEQEIHDALQS